MMSKIRSAWRAARAYRLFESEAGARQFLTIEIFVLVWILLYQSGATWVVYLLAAMVLVESAFKASYMAMYQRVAEIAGEALDDGVVH